MTIQSQYHAICMLIKNYFCICMVLCINGRIAFTDRNKQGATMEFHENRAAKPFSWKLIKAIFLMPYYHWQQRRIRACTRKILSRLSDSQLKDIGLTCDDVRRYK